jgi:4a-hydroxytetrahydrobiopterin dehydratase
MKETEGDLAARHCQPCEGGTPPLAEEEIGRMLARLEGWEYEEGEIRKTFHFKNYFRTMAFVNATAWISHRENHHPDLQVGYNTCRVSYRTHAIGGLSENDFICAARIDALMPEA